jgi:Mg/Co/Ni transporter MgtE
MYIIFDRHASFGANVELAKKLSVMRKLWVMKRYLARSVLVGCAAALLCTLWTAYWSAFYETPWVEGWVIFRSFLTFWLVWSLALSVVLPAVLSDEFSF